MDKETLLQELNKIYEACLNKKDFVSAGQINVAMDVVEDYQPEPAATNLERYKKYKEAFPNKTDAQCIESLSYEVSDKVETIHKLLAEIELLRKLDS